MARRKATFHNFESRDSTGKFVRISTNMMDSDAWLDLSIHARYLYLEMKRRYNGGECRTFNFPHSVGRKLMAPRAFTKAVNQLITHGFIFHVTYNRNARITTEYRFAADWQHWPEVSEREPIGRLPVVKKNTNKVN